VTTSTGPLEPTGRPSGDRCDLLVVGGGVIGLSIAWRAAGAGLSVTVVDPAPARGASWVAAGMLAPVTETHYGEAPLARLLLAGADRWPSFAAELEAAAGQPTGYEQRGTVVVAVDASDRAAIDELLAFQRQLGLAATRCSGSACRALVPGLAPGIRGGAEIPGDHQVDNRRLLAALLAACQAVGVTVVHATASVRRGPAGGAVGVALDDGRSLDAGTVVVATGSETSLLAGLAPGDLPPVRPVKGHVVRLRGRGDRPVLERTVRGLVHGRSCYLVPRSDGTLVVGATTEERGFDRTVQAGSVHALLDDARTLVPGIDELELVECQAGLRPGSPDNAPFIGWTGVDNVLVATGHYRNGILLAPLTAEGVVALLVGGELPASLAGCSPGRSPGLVKVA
jgi:glycine oxidase